METAIVAALVTVTSLAAAWLARRHRPLSAARLGVALATAMEAVGWCVLFFVVNVGVGLLAILAVRVFAGTFVSVYVLNDTSLVVLSALQGLIVSGYRAAGSMKG